MAAMVEFIGIKKCYGNKVAVKGLDLEINMGEIFALVGPNGAGKTSSLKMLVGLLKPTGGQIRIGGYDFAAERVKAKGLVSFVPDTPYVYEKLTPWELLRFVGKLYSMHPKVIEEEGTMLLEFFSLSHVQDVLIEEFSHGMRQKAVLASALVHQPKVFILDEPMVGLDPMSIKSFKDFIRRKAAEGMTIILSTHALYLAEELADRIGIIHEGELIALGSIKDLQKKYQSRENLENMFIKLVETEEIRSQKE
ncbi:MAG: ABC transporter ATP-binding protein [Candidatus Omnitrophota bacterium]|nr:ABC transporter ATP-binding protein [Candidatus Omnitrophota bacterium]